MRSRAPWIILLASVSFVIGSCRNDPWFLSSTANGAVFVGTRPEGEVVRATIRSSRRSPFGVLTLTPDSPDGGVFPVEPPISVRVEPSSLAVEPFELRDTSRQVRFLWTSRTECGPCSVDVDIVLTRTGDSGTPPIGVTWSLLASISGQEEVQPPGEQVTVVPR